MSEWGEQLFLFGRNGFPQPSPGKVREAERMVLRIARSRGLDIRRIRWKHNRRVMASIGKNKALNLHRIYQRATDKDIRALMGVLTGRAKERDRKRFDKFIERHLPRDLGRGKTRLIVRPPKGLFHDLERALKRVLPLLGKQLRPMPKVGWSQVKVGTRGITWGTHRITPIGPLIMVNAVLDAPDVPNFVVEHIVWHEICHQAVPPEDNGNGRRRVHSKAFRELEECYRRLWEAERWEEKNVVRLIRRHYGRGR